MIAIASLPQAVACLALAAVVIAALAEIAWECRTAIDLDDLTDDGPDRIDRWFAETPVTPLAWARIGVRDVK